MNKKHLSMAFIGSTLLLIFLIGDYSSVKEKTPTKKFGKENSTQGAKKPSPDRPGEAMAYEIALRSEYGKPFSYSGNWRFEAMDKARETIANKKTSYNWVERGPGNIGGRTRSIAVNPLNEDEWWVAAVGGGIWHSVDAGEHWENQSDDMPVISATTIAICLSSPDVLYAGTGEGFFNSDAVIGDGVFKTTNGGGTWVQLPATASNSNFRFVNRVIVDPQDPGIVIAATSRGVFRSQNGGDSWTKVFSGTNIHQIIANPQNFRTQFISDHGVGIYKSIDSGISWIFVSEEISPPGRLEMAMAPSDTNIVYVAVTASNYSLMGLYRSADAGDSWSSLGSSPNWLGSQGWYDNALAVTPNDPNSLITGGIDVYRIKVINNGTQMIGGAITHWFGGSGLPYVHADQHFFVLLPVNATTFKIIAANDGGIHLSLNSGVDWVEKNNGYNVTQFYDGDRHPVDDHFIAGSQDNGTNLSPSASVSTSPWLEVIGGDGFDCVWDKFNPETIYGTLYDTRIMKSTNGGQSFFSIGNGIGSSDIFHTPLALNPFDYQHLMTADENNHLYQTTNGGELWTATDLNFSSSRIKVAFSENNGKILWAGSGKSNLFLSVDKGANFTQIDGPASAPFSSTTGINTSKNSDSTAYLTFAVSGNPKIFVTHNLGQSWSDLTGDLPDVPVHTVAEMPYDALEIWAGTDIGLFITYDGGTTWIYSGDNLPAASIRRLKLVGKEVVAVTHGRGVFTTTNDRLSDFELKEQPPELQQISLGDPESREAIIHFFTRSSHDSIHLMVNDSIYKTYGNRPGFTFFDESYFPTSGESFIRTYVTGFTDGVAYMSNRDSLSLLKTARTNFTINFDMSDEFISSGLVIDKPAGFSSKGLHSKHDYEDANPVTATISTPVLMTATSGITYRDVALIEPGDPGVFYPADEMWDWVAVEGSLDGQNWIKLIQPYDMRFNATWTSAYNLKTDGDETMLVEQKIDLNDFFQEGDIVLVRFKLFADAFVNGWGWAVQDITVTDLYTGIENGSNKPVQFELYGNYPNPFNPGTTIKFAIEANRKATLEIFNIKGQRVKTLFRDKRFTAAAAQQIYWNGTNDRGVTVATGVYLYRLISGEKSFTKRMILLK